MESGSAFWVTGIVLGLSAGLSPGPLLALVFSETIRYGTASGVRVSMAPLISDAPIVAASFWVLSRFSDIGLLLGSISVCGAVFLAYLAWESLVFKGAELAASAEPSPSLRKGVLANFLNPNPYLFWFSIGGPILLRAAQAGTVHIIGFLTTFYLLLVGSKMVLAVGLGRSRTLLKSRLYIYTIRGLGLVLGGFAILFLIEGFRYLRTG
jgi:threonine/homoserine/homoserine lactone efflux protein